MKITHAGRKGLTRCSDISEKSDCSPSNPSQTSLPSFASDRVADVPWLDVPWLEEFPYEREPEFEAAREVPKKLAERELWAKKAPQGVVRWRAALEGRKAASKEAFRMGGVCVLPVGRTCLLPLSKNHHRDAFSYGVGQ